MLYVCVPERRRRSTSNDSSVLRSQESIYHSKMLFSGFFNSSSECTGIGRTSNAAAFCSLSVCVYLVKPLGLLLLGARCRSGATSNVRTAATPSLLTPRLLLLLFVRLLLSSICSDYTAATAAKTRRNMWFTPLALLCFALLGLAWLCFALFCFALLS